MVWHNVALPLHQQNETNQLKHTVMNTENTLARISMMMSSESFSNIIDMMNEMDLELMDISMA